MPRRRRPWPTIAGLCLALSLLAHGADGDDGAVDPVAEPAPHLLFEVATTRMIDLDELVGKLSGSRVILFGERHDSAADHEAQLRLLKALHARTPSLAVAFEIFSFESQPVLDRVLRGEAGEADLIREFSRAAARELYPLYAEIFAHCSANRIPLIGIRGDTQVLLKLFFRGKDGLTETERLRLPGFDPACAVAPKYESMMRLFASATRPFSFLGPDLGNTCDFFMGLDSVMAYKLAEHLALYPDRTVLALTGAFHAWKRGIPSHLGKFTQARAAVILPSFEDDPFLEYQITEKDADFVWWHP